MATLDVTTEHGNEILALRDTQFAARPTQRLDNSTLLIAEVKRVRDLSVAATNQDSLTVCVYTWDGVR